MTEFEFCFQVLGEPMWVRDLGHSSVGDRPKLVSAYRKLIKRAGDDLNHLGEASVFSPSENTSGLFFQEFEPPVIYLSPCLDNRPQAHVDYSLAHDFAHAIAHANGLDKVNRECICGAGGEDCQCSDCECEGCRNFELDLTPDEEKSPEDYVNFPPEYAADGLVLKWGYKLPAWKAKVRVCWNAKTNLTTTSRSV